MAFFIPPQHAIVHKEFNLLFQFWIHTELVDNIGPLEHIVNTASHHRVHHGANRYCLDKNYAGVLIIWDRMFGTFERERKDEKIVYGLVDQPQFFNPIKGQIFYYGKVLEKARSMPSWWDFFCAFVKGPGWFPGTDRLGDPSFVPENPVREKYNPPAPPLMDVYTILHSILAIISSDVISKAATASGPLSSLGVIGYFIWTLTSIGLLYDRWEYAWLTELIRCVGSVAFVKHLSIYTPINPSYLTFFYAGSSLVAMVGMLADNVINKTKKAQ